MPERILRQDRTKKKKKKKNKVIEEGFPYIVFPNMGYKKSCKAKEPKEIKKLY